MKRLAQVEYWLEHFVFPVISAVAVGLILRWAAIDVAEETLAQGTDSAARRAAAADLAAAQSACRSLVNGVSFKQHSLQELVDIRDRSFEHVNNVSHSAVAILDPTAQSAFRSEIMASFTDCSNLVIAAKQDPALASRLDQGRAAVWNGILEGSNWWSAFLLTGSGPLPPLDQRGYSPSGLQWWQDYAAWKDSGGADLSTFPGL